MMTPKVLRQMYYENTIVTLSDQHDDTYRVESREDENVIVSETYNDLASAICFFDHVLLEVIASMLFDDEAIDSESYDTLQNLAWSYMTSEQQPMLRRVQLSPRAS